MGSGSGGGGEEDFGDVEGAVVGEGDAVAGRGFGEGLGSGGTAFDFAFEVLREGINKLAEAAFESLKERTTRAFALGTEG